MPMNAALEVHRYRPDTSVFGRSLGEFALFEDVAPSKLAPLEAATQRRLAERGRIVYLPGDPSSALYGIVSGRVKVSRLSNGGKELILDFFEPGHCFGEAGVIEDRPRETVAEVLEPASLLVMPGEAFRRLLVTEPPFLMKLTRLLGWRQRKLERRLLGAVTKSAPRRLAELLLELSASYGVRDARGTLLRIRLSQTSIGSLLGVSREIVNHTFSDLKRRGVIDVSRGRVIIQDSEALAELAA